MTHIGILGAKGRMGQSIARLIESEFSNQASVFAQVDQDDSADALLKCDVVIDFSSPAGMVALAQEALVFRGELPAFVVGSTGWTPQERKRLEELATKSAVLLASNFSTGVWVVSDILKKYSPLLEKLGYAPVLVEVHHKHKKDAPSGTALTLRSAIDPISPDRIPTHCVRAGEVVGDHEISFYGTGEQIKILHSAQDRSIFARGAILVALWMAQQKKNTKAFKGMMGIENYMETLQEGF